MFSAIFCESRASPGLTKAQRRRFRPSMWPPARDLHLERCVRCLPFLANTGGFFVALLRKRKPWPQNVKSKPSQSERPGSSTPLQFSPDIPHEVAKDVGVPPSSLEDGSLMRRGARKLFYCNARLVSTLNQPRGKPLSLVSAGVCAFQLKRSPQSSDAWHLTLGGMGALKLKRGKETNAAAAKKSLEGHTCAACGERRHGSFFSRKMLTRPPSKRKCSDCVDQGLKTTAASTMHLQ